MAHYNLQYTIYLPDTPSATSAQATTPLTGIIPTASQLASWLLLVPSTLNTALNVIFQKHNLY